MAKVVIKTVITEKDRSVVAYDITDDKGNALESDKQSAYSINLSNVNVKIDIAQQSAKRIKLALDNITSKRLPMLVYRLLVPPVSMIIPRLALMYMA